MTSFFTFEALEYTFVPRSKIAHPPQHQRDMSRIIYKGLVFHNVSRSAVENDIHTSIPFRSCANSHDYGHLTPLPQVSRLPITLAYATNQPANPLSTTDPQNTYRPTQMNRRVLTPENNNWASDVALRPQE